MGRHTDNKSFLTTLRQMYNETRKWGSVTVTVKRMFEENFKGKKSMHKQRDTDRTKQVEEKKEEPFSLLGMYSLYGCHASIIGQLFGKQQIIEFYGVIC